MDSITIIEDQRVTFTFETGSSRDGSTKSYSVLRSTSDGKYTSSVEVGRIHLVGDATSLKMRAVLEIMDPEATLYTRKEIASNFPGVMVESTNEAQSRWRTFYHTTMRSQTDD